MKHSAECRGRLSGVQRAVPLGRDVVVVRAQRAHLVQVRWDQADHPSLPADLRDWYGYVASRNLRCHGCVLQWKGSITGPHVRWCSGNVQGL